MWSEPKMNFELIYSNLIKITLHELNIINILLLG